MSKKALLGGLLPFISNPVVLAVIGIGAIGWTVYEIFSDKGDEQDNGSETVPDGSEQPDEPLNYGDCTVPATVVEPFDTVETMAEETVISAVEEPHISKDFDDLNIEIDKNEAINEDDVKKEVIRQAMSELGKRSAAARKKGKAS